MIFIFSNVEVIFDFGINSFSVVGLIGMDSRENERRKIKYNVVYIVFRDVN